MLVGCSRTPNYDSRLLKADELMQMDPPDSALALLKAIVPGSLDNEADRAYHALLLTQARYKCYAEITSDDEINSAFNYYQHHKDEREKFTRCYIYKGAVMEELGEPETAMTYYKEAEVKAEENKDYFNKGYALLRMGKLYHNHHAYDGREIEKMGQALNCFERVNNAHYQIVCLKDLGTMYRTRNREQAEVTLNKAIALAKKVKETDNLYLSISSLAYLYFMKGDSNKVDMKKAYNLLQQIKSVDTKYINYTVFTTFACVYASLGMPDSAEIFLEKACQAYEPYIPVKQKNNYLEAKSIIAKARGDSLNYLKLSYICDRNSFSELRDPDIVKIMYAELRFDEEHAKQLAKNRRTNSYIIAAVLSAIILSLLLLALWFYRRAHRYDRLVVELKDQSQSQMNDLSGLQDNLSELKINDERLKGFISSHMSLMREMIEACYHEPNNRIAENMKRIVKFQDSNHDNWVKLYDYIDVEHNNIMTRTQQQYPQLNDRDLLLLALTCMGYSYIQTAIIMGYSNATSVSVIKQRLAKKMGLDCSLNEYIERNGGQKIGSTIE